MEEKKMYLTPDMEVLYFETEDVLSTSNETDLDPSPELYVE